MSPLAFNPSLFLADFRSALSRCGWPAYPQPMWWRCLEEADSHDLARKLTSYYQKLDALEYRAPTCTYYEKLFGETTAPRMNGYALKMVASERNPHALRNSSRRIVYFRLGRLYDVMWNILA